MARVLREVWSIEAEQEGIAVSASATEADLLSSRNVRNCTPTAEPRKTHPCTDAKIKKCPRSMGTRDPGPQ